MAEPTWKDKHVIELKKQQKSLEGQIKMDVVRHAESIETLKGITEAIQILEGKAK